MKKYVRLSKGEHYTLPRVQAVVREAGKARDCDPQGMYTGVPARQEEKPVQDADDL